jgi:hypothetical protein
MNAGRIIFSQLMDFVPKYEFNKCVARYRGHWRVRKFSCFDQFLCMAFAQLTYRDSLRDTITCLNAFQRKLYHAGFRGKIALSTLADANEKRPCEIYRDFALLLIERARRLYAGEDFGLQLDETVYALDATVIDLCLSLFPWATFRRTKAALKLHTLFDLRGNLPTRVFITPAAVHEVNLLDCLPLEAGAIYILDRAYLDFERLYAIVQASATYIIRAKSNLDCRRLYSHPVDKQSGLRSDQTIRLNGYYSSLHYPDALRRIHFFDASTQRRFIFLTNNFQLPALTVAELHRCRWQVELFFKWIKQHLRITSFFGTTENAVKTQIWIAISVYVLVAIIKKELKLEMSLYNILQLLSVTIFEKTALKTVLTKSTSENSDTIFSKQLDLLDF